MNARTSARRIGRHPLRRLLTLRGRLAVAAAGSLLLMGVMTAVLIQTSRTASQAVGAAQISQQRMRTFSRLQLAADSFQRATYAAVRVPNVETTVNLRHQRANFVAALRDAENLPVRTGRDARVQQQVHRQGMAVLALFSRGGRIVGQVDQMWRQSGSIAALQEIDRLSAPYFTLVAIVTSEITRGDGEMRDATLRAQRLQRAAVPVALVGMGLALLLSGIVLLLVIMRLGPGLKRLEEGVRAFGTGRTLHHIDMRGDDELTHLADAFNAMAEQLHQQQNALQTVATDLEQAVAERTVDLEQAHAALAAEDQRRRIFFAEVSHELRTPLTIIQGEAQVALRNIDSASGDPIGAFERILGQTRDLNRLVHDLFLIARAEADGLDMHLESLDVSALLARIVEDFEAVTSELGATIALVPSAPLFIHGDRMRFRQIIGALIDNALRHTQRGVAIAITAHAVAGGVEIMVDDNGPGVDPAAVDQLLQRFRRGNSGAEGAGLGLTIVRALVEAQGGRVRIANLPRGGLRISLNMPAAQPDNGGEEKDHARSSGGGGC